MAKKKQGIRALGRKEAEKRYTSLYDKDRAKQDFDYARVETLYSSFYAGVDPRRRIEMADGGMIQEDNNGLANLPTKGYQRSYPRAGFDSSPYIDDSVMGEE